MSRDWKIAFCLFCAAVFLRLSVAIPGIADPELLMRPDSATYLGPAGSLLKFGIYGYDGVPTGLRVPLYPLFLVPWLWLDGGTPGAFSIFANILYSSAAVPAVWFACREYGMSCKYSLVGAFVFLLDPTAVALSPMFLSDGIFATAAALELLFLILFIRRKEWCWLYLSALTGGVGGLIRPLNLLWIFPCLFVVLFCKMGIWKIVLKHIVLSFCLFSAILLPWIFRNQVQGFGWRIDTVSADSLKHNAAVVESRATGKPAQYFRDSYDAYFRKTFEEKKTLYSGENARLTYQEQYLSAIIKRYPFHYLRGFYHPVNYVPDVPSFLENLGLSQTGRGTWDVIVNQGLFAGVKHYFNGRYTLLLVLFPLCLIHFMAYLLAGFCLVLCLWKKKWEIPLLFVPMGLYYMTVTGPVAYPRFSLPVLPLICFASALGLQMLLEQIKRKKDKTYRI